MFIADTPPPPQDLENQALTETDTWREQQLHLEEQLATQTRGKQEAEAEAERCKQVPMRMKRFPERLLNRKVLTNFLDTFLNL